MKFALIILTLAVFAGASSRAEAQPLGHGRGMTQTFVYNNLTFSYSIGDHDFKDTPSWKPETDEVPFSTREALEAARLNLNRFVPDAAGWEVEKITLERFEPHKWVYEVAFHCWDHRCSDTGVSFTLFVKMDGSVIEPEVTQKTDSVNSGETQHFVAPSEERKQ